MYNGRLQVFHREPDRPETLALWKGSLLKQSLFVVEQNHELTWTDTFTYDGSGSGQRVEMSGSPSAVVWRNDLWVFHQGGTNNQALFAFVHNHENPQGLWNEDMHISDVELSESPCAVVANDRLHVFYQGAGHSGELWHIVTSDGKSWSKAKVPKTGMSSSPSVVFANGKLYVFHQGWGNNVRIWCNIKNEVDGDDKWFGDRPCFTANTNEAPGVVAYGSQLWCFHQDIYNLGELWHKEFPI
ncbi:hypothetical protein HII31_03265 [Pseudocercospora fuligena]|uniref:Uncharacterized protein n=1 Tax=Pseudocercospora fuligena TaxID=685502 RepID=A0A8H6VK34_9PEZI|nr:hypothetical protein HII31_03265 [Pseudocercospora fuligena]